MGFVLRLRVAPPAPGQTQVLQVLEGNNLWRATVTAAGTEEISSRASAARALCIDGRLDPILYDGRADDRDRPHRRFALWLSDDASRVPLRLSLPIGICNLVVELLDVQRHARL